MTNRIKTEAVYFPDRVSGDCPNPGIQESSPGKSVQEGGDGPSQT